MAVELRCPECRAKLRLSAAPEEGSEIECPKCGHVFPAPRDATAGKRDEPADEPRKKGGDAAAATKTAKKPNKSADPATPRKRKLKKRKSNRYLLAGVIVGGLMLLGTFIGAIVWFFNRTSVSMEMMTYLPADCDEVSGINLGHLQKYPEFYKNCESAFANTGFKSAADMFSRAIGGELKDNIDYVVQGVGRTGGAEVAATVLHTKEKYDTALLAKLPGAKEYRMEGVPYYTVNGIAELGYPGLRVFGPTDRLVVFCRGDMPDATFRAMLNGHKDDLEVTPFKRSGQLGKQVIRGTAWRFMIYGKSVARLLPPAQQSAGGTGGSEDGEAMLKREVAEILSSAQGCGYKASVGSRDLRGEFVVWYKDSEVAKNMLTKWKEKPWVLDSEEEAPKFIRVLAQKTGAGKTAEAVVRDGLSFRRSGETFSVRTAIDVNLIKTGISTLATTFPAMGATTESGRSAPKQGDGLNQTPPGGGGGGMPRRRRPGEVRRSHRS
jgi:hypothetical protein